MFKLRYGAVMAGAMLLCGIQAYSQDRADPGQSDNGGPQRIEHIQSTPGSPDAPQGPLPVEPRKDPGDKNPAEPPKQPAPPQPAAPPFFSMADNNGDGRLTFKEMKRYLPFFTLEMFRQVDIDHDGYLSREEVLGDGSDTDKDKEPVSDTKASDKTPLPSGNAVSPQPTASHQRDGDVNVQTHDQQGEPSERSTQDQSHEHEVDRSKP